MHALQLCGALVDETFGLSHLLPPGLRDKSERQFVHATNKVRPDLRVSALEMLANGLFHGKGVGGIPQLQAKLQDIVDSLLANGHLPVL